MWLFFKVLRSSIVAKISPTSAAGCQTCGNRNSPLNVGPGPLSYRSTDEVSQSHCLEELLRTCSRACPIILKNRPSLSPSLFGHSDIGFYDHLIYTSVEGEKRKTTPKEVLCAIKFWHLIQWHGTLMQSAPVDLDLKHSEVTAVFRSIDGPLLLLKANMEAVYEI